jgi:hypothetical protein
MAVTDRRVEGREMSTATNTPRRRRARVSIRATMLIVLAIAIVLGWQVNTAREQQRVVRAIQKYGGWVHYEHEFVNGKLTPGRSPWAPRWLRRMLGDEFFQTVRQVSLVYDDSTGSRFDNGNTRPCDDLLREVAELPGVKSIQLKETQTTDEGLRSIGQMSGLEELYMWDARSVTDAGVAHLAGLRDLKKIHISGSRITDDSLVLLSGLPRIEDLSLQQNHFSDEGLKRLRGQDRLKWLYIGLGDGAITDAGLEHLAGFRKLEELDLQKARITARGLEWLKGLGTLKMLWLSETGLTDDDLRGLREALPNARIPR